MIGTPAIRNLIREGKIAKCIGHSDRSGQGMQTLDQCLQELVAKGVVIAKKPSTKRRIRILYDALRATFPRVAQSANPEYGAARRARRKSANPEIVAARRRAVG